MSSDDQGTPSGGTPSSSDDDGGNSPGNHGLRSEDPLRNPGTVTIYFGPGGTHGVENVSSTMIDITNPEFLRRFTRWGIIEVPPAPPEICTAFVFYLYTGIIRFPLIDQTSSEDDVADALKIAVHMYSQGEINEIVDMKQQATDYLEFLHRILSATKMRLYVEDVIEPFFPDINYGWIKAQAALESPDYNNYRLSQAFAEEREAEERRTTAANLRGDKETSDDNKGPVHNEDPDNKDDYQIIGEDGLIDLDQANWPPGVTRW